MIIVDVPIFSCPRADCQRPWYEVECSTADLRAGLLANKDGVGIGMKALALDQQRSLEEHILAITLNGQVEFVAASQQRPVYRAHLAFFNPVTQTWRRLVFIDDGGP